MNRHNVQLRLIEILRRHIAGEDIYLSDHDLVMRIFGRYQKERAQPLIDPNE